MWRRAAACAESQLQPSKGRAGRLQPAWHGTALCAAEAPGQGSAGARPSPAAAWVCGIWAGNAARLCRSPCWRPSPLRPGLRLSKPRASSGARATEPPSLDGDGEGARAQDTARSLLPCPLALKLPKPPNAEAVCLQLDRSSASPACLLRFLILGVGLSKSRAEPPRDQGEAGGGLQFQVPFFFSSPYPPPYFFFSPSSLCTQSRAMMKLQLRLARSVHAQHMLEIIVLGGALQAAERFNRKRGGKEFYFYALCFRLTAALGSSTRWIGGRRELRLDLQAL